MNEKKQIDLTATKVNENASNSATASKAATANKTAAASKSKSASKAATANKTASASKSKSVSKAASESKSKSASKSTSKAATASKSKSASKAATASKGKSASKAATASKGTSVSKTATASKSASASKAAPKDEVLSESEVATPSASENTPEIAETSKSSEANESSAGTSKFSEATTPSASENIPEIAETSKSSEAPESSADTSEILSQIKKLEDEANALKAEREKKKMKPSEVVASVATWTVLAFALIALIFAVIVNIGGNKTALFGHGFFSVSTNSMQPEINAGDMVIAKKFNNVSELVEGESDILFYYEVDGTTIIVIHRVIEINGNTVTTHGINNPIGANETVQASNIIAVRTATLRGVGNFFSFTSSLAGFLLLIVLPILLLIGIEVVHIYQIMRGKYDDEDKSDDDPSSDSDTADKESTQVAQKIDNADEARVDS